MTTTDLKENSTPAISHSEDSNFGKNTSGKKAVKLEYSCNERDKESFYKDLQIFHENRNTPLAKFPKVNGREIDLQRLYSEVISRGGWLKVNIRNEWDELLPILGLKRNCVNASVAIKYIYTRYLDKYEKANFLGEDPDKPEEPEDEGRHKKWSSKSIHSVPMVYNYAQHNIPEPIRILHKMSTDMYKESEYDKLLLSLLSPLPNEQDFAINVCTLMVNEAKHTLKLDHCPKLLDFLIAHAGVYSHFTTRDLFHEIYTKTRKHSLQSFWIDCLYHKPHILELSYEDYLSLPDKVVDMGLGRPPLRLPKHNFFEDGLVASIGELHSEIGKLDFLALGRELGTKDYIGQRVNQISSIVRNLSFFEENTTTLAKNRTFIRYLVMCSNIRWGNVHHMALDVMGNIANEILLGDPSSDELTRCLFSTLCEGLEGQDRGVIISCLEILYKLCQKNKNEDPLYKCLDQKVFNQICLFLTLNDIMLLLYTLECVYALTSLGHKTCNTLVQVKGLVDSLVSLITVEAQSYGADGCISMRVVETVPGNMLPMVAQNIANLQNVAMHNQSSLQSQATHLDNIGQSTNDAKKNLMNNQTFSAMSSNTNTENTLNKINPLSNQQSPIKSQISAKTLNEKDTPQQQLQENEQAALAWLAATFERVSAPSSCIEQQELYRMYLSASQKIGRRGVVSPMHFPRLVRTIFGNQVGPNFLKTTESTSNDNGNFFYVCLRLKANPLPVQNKNILISQQVNQTSNSPLMKTSRNLQKSQQPNETINKNKTEGQAKGKGTKKNQLVQHQFQQPQQYKLQTTNINQSTLVSTSVQNNNQNKPQQQNKILTSTVIHQQQSQPPTPPPMPQNFTTRTINNSIILSTQKQINGPIQQSDNQGIGIPNGNGCSGTPSSLIKSLLANKVTTPASDIAETIASAAPNNPSCLITQNVNLHQVAQRQHLQKQKEIAQQQHQNKQISISQNINLQNHNQIQKVPVQQTNLSSTAISAIVNNAIIQSAPVKVGQTTIKAIPTKSNNCNPGDKRPIICNENSESITWEPIPPLAPLTINGQGIRYPQTTTGIMTSNEDSNSIGNISITSSAVSSTPVLTTDDGENSLISFEGLLIPKSKSQCSSIMEDDTSSKDSIIKVSQISINSSQANANELKKEVIIEKNLKRRLDDDQTCENGTIIKKRVLEEMIECYDDDLTVTPSKNAANLYAEIAASILEDEDLEDESIIQHQIQNNIIEKSIEQKQMITVPLQRQIIVGPNNQHQVFLTQSTTGSQQVQTQATATMKSDSGLQTVPLILQKQVVPTQQQLMTPVIQQPAQQTQFVLATNPQGQTYLVAQQPQATLNQTLLVTQASQQQGTATKTIIILQQPSGAAQAVAQQQLIGSPGSTQKMIMTTQQGQQMFVTQVPRTMQHHQILVNHSNSIISNNKPSSGNVVITQSGAIQQQHQTQLQLPQQIQSQGGHIQKTIQIQTTPQVQLQSSIINQAHQQQSTIFSQLSHIPATIKIHPPQSVQTQTTQTQNQILARPPTPKGNNNVIQQVPMTLVPQQQLVMPQQSQTQLVGRNQERKQIFITSSGTVEATELPNPTTQSVPVSTQTSAVLTPPPIRSNSPAPPIKTTKTLADIKSDEDLIDPNWMWVCDWRGCARKKYKSLNDVYRHACLTHCPESLDPTAEIYCQWGIGPGLCDNIPRKRFSLMTHLYDRHCTIESFKNAVQRRLVSGFQPIGHTQPLTIIKNPPTDQRASASPALSTSSTGSIPTAASAAMHAIKRHSAEFINPKELLNINCSVNSPTTHLSPNTTDSASITNASYAAISTSSAQFSSYDENEGPVTKSIRLTAALILRNLVSNTTLAKRNVRQYEPHLAGIALSNVESSWTVSQILYELNN